MLWEERELSFVALVAHRKPVEEPAEKADLAAVALLVITEEIFVAAQDRRVIGDSVGSNGWVIVIG